MDPRRGQAGPHEAVVPVPDGVPEALLRRRLRHALQAEGRPVRALHVRRERREAVPARLAEGPVQERGGRLLHQR